MVDDLLGRLAEEGDDLVGVVRSEGWSVPLRIHLEGAGKEEVLPHARQLVGDIVGALDRARREMVAAILPTVNRGYRDPAERPVTEDEFLKRARLELVEVLSEGHLLLHFADDDMLAGHRITVTRDPGGRWTCEAWG